MQPRDIIPRLAAATEGYGLKVKAAEIAGVSRSEMTEILKGRRGKNNPKLDRLQRLYEALIALDPTAASVGTPTTPSDAGAVHASAPRLPPELEGAVPSSSDAHIALYYTLCLDLTPAQAKAFREPLMRCIAQFKASRRGRGGHRKQVKEGG